MKRSNKKKTTRINLNWKLHSSSIERERERNQVKKCCVYFLNRHKSTLRHFPIKHLFCSSVQRESDGFMNCAWCMVKECEKVLTFEPTSSEYFFCLGDYAKLSPNYNCMCDTLSVQVLNNSVHWNRYAWKASQAIHSFNKVFGSIKDNPSAYKSIWWLLQMHNALSSPGNLKIELGACLQTILMVFLLKFPFSIVNLLYSSFHSSTFVLLLTDAVSIVGCVVP